MQESRWRTMGVVIAAALVLASAIASAVAYPHLPARVAVHWSLGGEPDRYTGPLGAAITMPIIMLVTALVLIVAPRFDRGVFIRYGDRDPDRSTNRPVYPLIVLLALGAMLAVHLLMLATALGAIGPQKSPLVMAVVLSLILIALGNYLPRVTRRNAFIGVRLPWVYASDEVWRRTQRIGGYGMVLVGVAGLIASLAGAALALPVLGVGLVVYVVVIAVWSYALAHSRRVG